MGISYNISSVQKHNFLKIPKNMYEEINNMFEETNDLLEIGKFDFNQFLKSSRNLRRSKRN